MTNPNLPAFLLQRTPAQIEADEARQVEMRQGLHAKVTQNAEERMYTQAIETEKIVRQNLEVAEPEMEGFYRSKLAESLSQQGRFTEAAEIEPDEEKRDWYLKVQEAIDRDDNESCDCRPEAQRDPQTGQMVTLPTSFVRAMVFSPKHGKVMPLVECSCGSVNVK